MKQKITVVTNKKESLFPLKSFYILRDVKLFDWRV